MGRQPKKMRLNTIFIGGAGLLLVYLLAIVFMLRLSDNDNNSIVKGIDKTAWQDFIETSYPSQPNRIISQRVIYTMFAGRRRYLEIHFRYTDILLQKGLVSEVHLWDYTGSQISICQYCCYFLT